MNHNNKFWDECYGQVSDERIKFVESTLNIHLPTTYVNLIKSCDGGCPIKSDFEYYNIFHGELWKTGIGNFIPLNPSPYEDMLKFHSTPPEFFPEGLIAFAEIGNGNYICFDYRQGKDNPNPPIVYWNHGADIGKDVSFVANNFEEFLGMLKEPED